MADQRHMPSALLHFLLMMRIDRVRVRSRFAGPTEGCECARCGWEDETLAHVIFACTDAHSTELRKSLIDCLDTHEIDTHLPCVQSLLSVLRSPPPGSAHLAPQLRLLLGFCPRSNNDKIPKKDRLAIFDAFKRATLLIHRAWRRRSRAAAAQ